ncbi:MAG: hypothetical protein LBC41_01915 [Clostridiales bacterium]|jgi:hypothetical protein|nr:hypothetical protein [Clostridiales bacterium]MDR2749391.1 hypothetical protein [Clostridiales bacterium]
MAKSNDSDEKLSISQKLRRWAEHGIEDGPGDRDEREMWLMLVLMGFA